MMFAWHLNFLDHSRCCEPALHENKIEKLCENMFFIKVTAVKTTVKYRQAHCKYSTFASEDEFKDFHIVWVNEVTHHVPCGEWDHLHNEDIWGRIFMQNNVQFNWVYQYCFAVLLRFCLLISLNCTDLVLFILNVIVHPSLEEALKRKLRDWHTIKYLNIFFTN